MKKRGLHRLGVRVVAFTTVCAFALSGMTSAQTSAPPTPSGAAVPANPTTAPGEKTFSQQELDQLLAPIALYPDELLAQVLMASTYPLDIVSAERWVKANPNLKDKALEDALQNQPWDPSVKSLAVFPQVVTMMSEKLDWTQKLGDAFLAQQEDVMRTAQALRQKAIAQGALKDSKEQKVITEKTQTTTIIRIEPSSPQVVYVPTYNPTVVYGAWPYPAYPPYYYYPPGYVAGAAFVGFTAGVAVGSALWGGCNWGHNDVNINVNRYNSFNKTNVANGNWQHNADRRGAVPYKDRTTAQKYNRAPSANAQARDAYRGRTDSGFQQARGDAARGGRTGPTAGTMESRGRAQGFDGGASGTRGASAFDTGSRAQTRNYSSRGESSMSSARASGGMTGARASGGMRTGGGARAGGGRGGRR
jgi:hypothetical protein